MCNRFARIDEILNDETEGGQIDAMLTEERNLRCCFGGVQLLTSENWSLSVLTSNDQAGQAGPVGYKGIKKATVRGEDQDRRLFGGGLLTNHAHTVTT